MEGTERPYRGDNSHQNVESPHTSSRVAVSHLRLFHKKGEKERTSKPKQKQKLLANKELRHASLP